MAGRTAAGRMRLALVLVFYSALSAPAALALARPRGFSQLLFTATLAAPALAAELPAAASSFPATSVDFRAEGSASKLDQAQSGKIASALGGASFSAGSDDDVMDDVTPGLIPRRWATQMWRTAVSEKVWPQFGFNPRIIIASVISFVGAALANAGGVGGGGLFVPMFNLLVGYDAKTSTALSKSMVMGGAIASVYFNVHLKHPDKHCSLIDYDVARLMQPMLLLGISIGVLCNVMFPPWIITALLVTVLLMMTVKTLEKGWETRRKEKNALAAAASATAREVRLSPDGSPESGPARTGSAITEPLLDVAAEGSSAELRSQQDAEPPEGYAAAAAAALARARGGLPAPVYQQGDLERSQSIMERLGMGTVRQVTLKDLVDWKSFTELIFVWGLYLAIQGAQAFTEKCSLPYWVLVTSQVPISVVATLVAAVRLYEEHKRRLSGESHLGCYTSDEQQWGVKDIIRFPACSLTAGVVGGLLGIGGGMIMGPVLLELGLKPQVVSATSTFIVIFSSSLSVLEFYLLGRIPLEVAVYFCALAIFAALVGLSIVRSYVMRSGKASVIIFLLGGVIGVSGLLMGSLGTAKLYQDWVAGKADTAFRSPCSSAW